MTQLLFLLLLKLQGFGNVGSWTARLLHEQGGIVKAVSDVTGAIKNDAGLDIAAVQKHVAKVGGIKGFSGGEAIESQALLAEDCDVLIPAALGGVITRYGLSISAIILVSCRNVQSKVLLFSVRKEIKTWNWSCASNLYSDFAF